MMDYVALLQEAKQRVNGSPLYRRFIDGTPLENDIAVWMADFASEQQPDLTALRAATAAHDAQKSWDPREYGYAVAAGHPRRGPHDRGGAAMTCTQHDCQADAIVRVFWPGRVPPPVYCLLHAVLAERILQAMGCPVASERIEDLAVVRARDDESA
jgi:hypothetical protein